MVGQVRRTVFAAAFAVMLSAPALAQTGLTTLYAFPGYGNGYFPRGGLAMDSSGALYGTTYYGGMYQGQECPNCGTIYKLTPSSPGHAPWSYQLLHTFTPDPIQGYNEDGIDPISPLVNYNNVFYGTTNGGGDNQCGCGAVFSITPNGTYTLLHVFDPFIPGGGSDQWPLGTTPVGGLLIANGTIYGTTDAGGTGQPGPDGTQGAGIIYQMNLDGSGFTKLHDFDGSENGGPEGMMIFGQDGAIYGTQYGGGKYNQGLIFRITTAGSYQDIYDFQGVNQPGGSHDGAQPEGRLALGPDGTIYGTTTFGGSPSGYGTAWSIKEVNGSWVYTQIYIFGSAANLPHSGLVRGSDGALYGTGAGGGAYQSGAIYRLTPPTTGTTWNLQLLHSFIGRDPNGDTPYADLLYANGTFYGANLNGGDVSDCGGAPGGCGTVFQFNPLGPAHDFNGDFKSDILWHDTSGDVSLWLMNGGQVSRTGGLGKVATTWSIIGQRDMNADGAADILWRDTSGDLSIWFMTGTQVVATAGLGTVPTNWTVYGTADLSNDDKGDLLWRDTAGDTAVWLMNGSQVIANVSLGNVPTNWTIVAETTGTILWQDTSGDLALWSLQNGQVVNTCGLGSVSPSVWKVRGLGDFDANGAPDILWQDTSGDVAIWFLDSGCAITSTAGLGNVGTTWSVAQLGDYNGDGMSDILWKNTTGTTAVWFMNGGTVVSSASLGNLGTTWTAQQVNAE